jgi:hypothetical protein
LKNRFEVINQSVELLAAFLPPADQQIDSLIAFARAGLFVKFFINLIDGRSLRQRAGVGPNDTAPALGAPAVDA